MLRKLYNLSTGVGSLPHTDPQKAISLINRYFPEMPHWPQLPNCGDSEGFIVQYLSPLISCGLLSVKKSGAPYFCTDKRNWIDLLAAFYEQYLECMENPEKLELFSFPPQSATGFYSFIKGTVGTEAQMIKGQITGPVTLGLQVIDALRKPSFYRDDLRDVLTKTLVLQTKWQIRQLQHFNRPILVAIDEPSIYAFGQSSYVGLSRSAITESIGTVVEAVHSEGELAGVHCCAGTDWSLLFELPLDMINFDAFSYFPSMLVYYEQLAQFLDRGGCLAWGIVPTSVQAYEKTSQEIIDQMDEEMETLTAKGICWEKLQTQKMITPSCGTGSLDEKLAEHIYRLTREVYQKVLGV